MSIFGIGRRVGLEALGARGLRIVGDRLEPLAQAFVIYIAMVMAALACMGGVVVLTLAS